jgi:hypothetical protein
MRAGRRRLRVSLLLGQRLQQRRALLPTELLWSVLRSVTSNEARAQAARVWRQRHRSELEAMVRFGRLSSELARCGASSQVVALASQAALDELEHAELCRGLVEHFGGTIASDCVIEAEPVAPRHWPHAERLLYELVAMSCVTETLSTALLGALVESARDPLVRRTMLAVLRDEVMHSKLGWAFLAEQHQKGRRPAIGEHLPAMLDATVGPHLFQGTSAGSELTLELSGLGCLDVESCRRIVRETLELVVFPGLARFGVEVNPGLRWLSALPPTSEPAEREQQS